MANSAELIGRFSAPTVSVAWEVTQELVRKEDERFRHIDTKANTFLGMLALAITVLVSLGTLVMSQKLVKRSPGYFRTMLGSLLIGASLSLVVSFFFGLLTTQVITDPSLGGHYGISPRAIIGPESVGLDVAAFKKGLVTEGWEVLSKNVRENNRKATNLLRSQVIASYAAVALAGMLLLFVLAFITGPPREAQSGPARLVGKWIKGLRSCYGAGSS